jgi:RIO kinase 1
MFHTCKLVHADLSEYNILYHEGHLWIIDVSQSVEHDHPSAFDFLRNDIKNVEEFFGRLGVKCLGLRRCFEFVTREQVTVSEDDEEIAFARWLEGDIETEETLEIEEVDTQGIISVIGELSISLSDSEQRSERKRTRKEEDMAHEDSVFLHSYIPRNLTDVYDPERDVEKLKKGDDLIYAKTIGFVRQKKQGEDRTEDLVDEKCSGEESALGSEDEVGESEENAFIDKKPRGHKHEVKEVKKVCPL